MSDLCLVLVFPTIFLLDFLFKKYRWIPYLNFLYYTGIEIEPIAICVETKRLNRPFVRCSSIKPNWIKKWFQVGAFVVSLSVIPSLCMIYVPIYQFFKNDDSTPILAPSIPGLNQSSFQRIYFAISLCISTAFHEFGHALAASREKVPIEVFGIKIVLFMPLAYASISYDHINRLNVAQQLRIHTAGIWHNLVLAALTLALVSANPHMLKPLYLQGIGVTVTDVKQGSGHEDGLMKGDTVIGLNECFIRTQTDWKTCINKQYGQVQSGFCADEAFYKKEDISIKKNGTSDCCPQTSKHACFRIGVNTSLDASYLDIRENLGQVMCLPARKLAENHVMCWGDQDCYKEFCLMPVLDSESDRFLTVKLSSGKRVFYVGQMEEIFSSVTISSWVSEHAPVYYIDKYELLLGYIFSCSCFLAILHTIPFFILDGSYIIKELIHGYLKPFFVKVSHRRRLEFVIKMAGCVGMIFYLFVFALVQFG